MRLLAVVTLCLTVVTGSAAKAQLVLNDLSSHRHGHGDLFIQFQGKSLFMVLEVPGWDIVGFEGDPENTAQSLRIEAGEDKLLDTLTLFELPDAAKCTVNRSAVTRVAGTLQKDADAGGPEPQPQGTPAQREQMHTAFIAEYSIICKDIDQIDRIAFPYFDKFPNTKALTAIISTQRGESVAELNRSKKTIELKDLR